MENNNTKILIIDDDIAMMDMLSVMLSKYNYSVIPFTEPVSAIESLKSEHYDILIINYIMSPVNGDRVVELVREFNKEIYIIMMSTSKDLIPSVESMRKLDIQAYFEKNSRFDQLILSIETGVKYTKQLNNILNMKIKLENQIIDFANVLLKAVDAKDNYTATHSKHVCEYALRFADYINLDDDKKNTLKLACLFHDIGKIGIPDNILTKSTKLTVEEFSTIKYHPTIGANILGVSAMFSDVTNIINTHHERLDGTGYPNGLSEVEIPYLSKILSICDTFDAITTKRSYKETCSIDYAIKELTNAKGTQLDSILVDKFISLINTDKKNFIIKE
ncbi:MAG: HD domain-containing protein [Clostridia bacterium]